jgi:hypothetical protein
LYGCEIVSHTVGRIQKWLRIGRWEKYLDPEGKQEAGENCVMRKKNSMV